jgi:DGQHR domain-containing protein
MLNPVTFRFKALRATQAAGQDIFTFAAAPQDILKFADIDRVGRNNDGSLRGFQRHQVSAHIREIKDYLAGSSAILPNAVIVAFMGGVTLTDCGDGTTEVCITCTEEDKPGFVVDGQQRLTALSQLDKPGFQVFVSALTCRSYNELRQQFVLINSTRPLPKTLVYELLPTVDSLPQRLTGRQFAAEVVNRLNFDPSSSLRGEIRQHTNPKGTLSDLAMQKLVMNSAGFGAIRELEGTPDRVARAAELVSEFFAAVRLVFPDDWTEHTATSSRLKHGAGLVAMGFVMELLYSHEDAKTAADFEPGLRLLKPHTAWTKGHWKLSPDDLRPWQRIQNTGPDISLLSNCLVSTLRKALHANRRPQPALGPVHAGESNEALAA